MRKGTKLGSGVALAALTGCASPNLYTTPRSLGPGQYSSLVAPQLLHLPAEHSDERDRGSPHYGVLFGGRVGVVRGVDAGARTNFSSLGLDLKWNAIRGRTFDLALDAGVELLPYTIYFNLPILMGINVGDHITLLPSTGFTLGEGHEPQPSSGKTWVDPQGMNLPPAGRSFLRTGFGAQLRVTPRFAVQPELTYLWRTKRGTPTRDFMAVGLGFCFGAQPY